MKEYTQITLSERTKIQYMLWQSCSIGEIARILNRHRSTIYREIRRNTIENEYMSFSAHFQSLRRCKREPYKLRKGSGLYQYVVRQLKHGWTPEQISGYMARKHFRQKVCFETIYQHIYKNDLTKLYQHLPHSRKQRRKRGKRKPKLSKIACKSIINRPEEVKNRDTIGHWEGDTIRFSKSKHCSVTTLVERKSRLVKLIKNERSNSETVMTKMNNVIKSFKRDECITITVDQGSEFFYYKLAERDTPCKIYFADVKSPWQRGTNENTNRRLRKYLPRNMLMKHISQDKLKSIEFKMNNTPRKCLNYKTPFEVFFEKGAS